MRRRTVKKLGLVLFTVALSVISGCQYNELKTPADGAEQVTTSEPSTNPGTGLGFQTIRSQILEPHCLKCHSSAVHKAGVVLEGYEQVFALQEKIRTAIETDDMPRRAPPLSPELKQLLFTWLDAGLPENN